MKRGSVGLRLSTMMLLQYAVWGVWLIILPNYLGADPDQGGLGFSGKQVGWILGLAGSIGAICAPFIAGQVADRYLNAERALALLLISGGIVKIITAFVHDYWVFLALSVLYSILFMPTLALTNSVALTNLDDPERKFPVVRSMGTLGWIVTSSLFPLLWLSATDAAGAPDAIENTRRVADALVVSGAMSILYAGFCLRGLPSTPPKRSVEHPLAFARAFGLLRHRGFLVVTLVGVPISTIHSAYFFRINPFLTDAVDIPLKWTGLVLSLGQWSELVFLALLALFIKRIGYKWVLALGCLGYVVRFAIFASTDSPAMVTLAQGLHGVCYGCFFAGAYIYVDRVAPADIRHSAQTVFAIIMLGLGPILAGLYNGIFDRFKLERLVDGTPMQVQSYDEFWWAQSAVALVSTVVLLALFRPGVTPATTDPGESPG